MVKFGTARPQFLSGVFSANISFMGGDLTREKKSQSDKHCDNF